MTYTTQTWTDNVTPVDKAHMDHIEQGILAAAPSGAISYGSTPPASPADGDLWCFPADATNGVNWMFRYRAASASAYKWEFVGGAPATAIVNADESSATINAWTDVTTVGPQILPGRAGEYVVSFNAFVYSTGAGATLQSGVAANAGTPVLASIGGGVPAGASLLVPVSTTFVPITLAATDYARLRYYSNVVTLHTSNRALSLLPKRVS